MYVFVVLLNFLHWLGLKTRYFTTLSQVKLVS